MTSEHKIKTNRANAQASTGPKTADGRARAARNALRHALSLPVCSNPALSEEVETLAREIAGPGANAETQDLARQVAEALRKNAPDPPVEMLAFSAFHRCTCASTIWRRFACAAALCGPCVASSAPVPVASVPATKLRRVGMDHPP